MPRPRPRAEPEGRGVVSYRFDVVQASGPVVVTSWDPDSLADQAGSWIFPPELASLADLAHRLTGPAAWLGDDAFVEPPVPYAPLAVVVQVDLLPDVGRHQRDEGVDVDDVDWPTGEPIEAAGDPSPGGDARRRGACPLPPMPRRCGRQRRRGGRLATRPRGESVVEYDWGRADGFVQVAVRRCCPTDRGPASSLFDPA